MTLRRTTFSKFIIEAQHGADADLTALLNDIQTACKFVALAVARGSLHEGDVDRIAADIMFDECAQGGTIWGMMSESYPQPAAIPPVSPRGPYLLAFGPLDGASNLDINLPAGTIFSVMRAPPGKDDANDADFLRAADAQVAAGFALYGPSSMLVITLGAGVYGFTLDREIGAYTLTHPDMRIPEHTREFAIDASNERFWEPPVRHYVEECVQGTSGPRGEDFNMRWMASMVADVHRVLVRGGLFISPRDGNDPADRGRISLMCEARPMAMIVEQAGGIATTGRQRLLDLMPANVHQRVPVILGSRHEVERLLDYHAIYDRGDDLVFDVPLFNRRSMFRTA